MSAYLKLGAVLLLLAALLFFEHYIEQRGADRQLLVDLHQADELKIAADKRLAEETEKVHAKEQALQDITTAQNVKDYEHEKTVATLSDRIRAAGRLRDPHAGAGCGGGSGGTQSEVAGPAGDRSGDEAETGGLLSEQLTGLLQRLQLEADTINEAYASCRAQAYAVRSP